VSKSQSAGIVTVIAGRPVYRFTSPPSGSLTGHAGRLHGRSGTGNRHPCATGLGSERSCHAAEAASRCRRRNSVAQQAVNLYRDSLPLPRLREPFLTRCRYSALTSRILRE
jgi:hypothetical protein